MKISRAAVAMCLVIVLGLFIFLFAQSDGGRRVLGLYTLNNNRIVFYGKLEDQFGNPLPNTTVSFDVRVYNGFRSGVDRGSVVSDANGFFKISGYSGESLSVVPHKNGYAIASLNGGGFYSALWPESQQAHPDPKNPVIIKMWKAQGAEPLIGIGMKFELPYTNAPIRFDLLTGTIVSNGGDIQITITRPPGIISERNPQVWSLRFDAIDGGLMNSSGAERITYFAPEDGYQPSISISSTNRLKLPANGIGGFAIGLYVKSRNGQVYSKVGFDFGINENPNDLMYVELNGVANTNRSRNWEGAPNTYLNP